MKSYVDMKEHEVMSIHYNYLSRANTYQTKPFANTDMGWSVQPVESTLEYDHH
jgi:hypothetical protein